MFQLLSDLPAPGTFCITSLYLQTLAEQAAWDMAKKEGFDLVVINPTLVIGPIISARTDATSIKNVKALIECESEQILSWLCDVRVSPISSTEI